MTEWKEFKFSDFVHVNPKVSFSSTEKVPFVEMKDIEPSNKFCTFSQFRALGGGSRFANHDTLFARITPCLENGKIAQVRKLPGGQGFGSTEFHVLRGRPSVSNTEFVYYLSRWNDVRDFAELNLHGTSGRQRFPAEAFKELELLLPPLSEQVAIAEVLSSLDDKIDLLHRNNETLEQLGETLFRQWFVETSYEESEEVPFSNIAQHLKKSINPSQNKDRMFYHYSLPAFDNGKRPELSHGKDILSNKYEVTPGSVLISKLNPATPRVWNIQECGRNSISSTEFQVYQAKQTLYQQFVYYFLKSSEATDILTGAASGTSGSHQRVNPDVISNLRVKLPSEGSVRKFNIVASDSSKKIYKNTIQIQQLENLRDTLIPKLMSGVVRVIM